MRISDSCVKCMYDRQKNKTDNAEYLAEVKAILENRGENDVSPYLVYRINKAHERYFGPDADFREIKREYNDLVLNIEDELRRKIEEAEDPLARALVMARIGNYIDFGAMNHVVDRDEFLELFADTDMRPEEAEVYESFLSECQRGKKFLLICDNCGEVVLDKLMLEELSKRFSHLEIKAMVRGADVFNDATVEDAEYAGLNKVAEIVSNGSAIAGVVYDMMPSEAQQALDEADIILAKGMGNYESMYGLGWHAFFEFLCKCELFINRFNVPKLTGMFIEEK